MTSIERTAYPRFKRYYTQKELKQIYTPTKAEIALAFEVTAGKENYFKCLVLLKSFQRLGYFPKMEDIPVTIVRYIQTVLECEENILCRYECPQTLSRHKKAIRSYLQITPFNQKAKNQIIEVIKKSTLRMDNPADLINIAIEVLVKERYELPGFYTLDRLVAQTRNLINKQLFTQVFSQLSPDYVQDLKQLLDKEVVGGKSAFNNLKKISKKYSRNHLNDLIIHLTWLETLGDAKVYLKSLTGSKIKHFAAEAKALNASEIKKIRVAKRLTLVLCLIDSAQVQTRDALVAMFLKQIKKIHYKGQEKLSLIREQQQEKTENLLSVLSRVLQVVNEEDSKKFSWEQITEIFQEKGGVDQLLAECEEINAYQKNNYFPLLWGFYKSHRSSFFRVFNSLKLESTSSDKKLIKALDFLLSNSDRRSQWLEGDIDLSFASQPWQKLVVVQHKNVLKFARRHFEICVFSYLASELKSGDLCVMRSGAYADYREQLLSWEDCQELMPLYCQQLNFSNNQIEFIEHLKSWLSETAEAVDLGYPNNTCIVINEQGEPVLKRPQAKKHSVSLQKLEAIISERMPERNLIDILRDVDYWTNFTRHFGPLSGREPKLERAKERYLLTTFTYGCNLGATQASRHMRGVVSPFMLTFINQRHISLKGLNQALVDIINRYQVMDLTKFWGEGKSAAADGTKYDRLRAELSFRIPYSLWRLWRDCLSSCC